MNNWRVWLIFDNRDRTVFAIGAGPEGVGQPMPDDVAQKIAELGRHAKVHEIGSGLAEAEAREKWKKWQQLPPVAIRQQLFNSTKKGLIHVTL